MQSVIVKLVEWLRGRSDEPMDVYLLVRFPLESIEAPQVRRRAQREA